MNQRAQQIRRLEATIRQEETRFLTEWYAARLLQQLEDGEQEEELREEVADCLLVARASTSAELAERIVRFLQSRGHDAPADAAEEEETADDLFAEEEEEEEEEEDEGARSPVRQDAAAEGTDGQETEDAAHELFSEEEEEEGDEGVRPAARQEAAAEDTGGRETEDAAHELFAEEEEQQQGAPRAPDRRDDDADPLTGAAPQSASFDQDEPGQEGAAGAASELFRGGGGPDPEAADREALEPDETGAAEVVSGRADGAVTPADEEEDPGVLFREDIYSGVGRSRDEMASSAPAEADEPGQAPGTRPARGRGAEEMPGFKPTRGHEARTTPGFKGADQRETENTPGFKPTRSHEARTTPGFKGADQHETENTPGFKPTRGHEAQTTPGFEGTDQREAEDAPGFKPARGHETRKTPGFKPAGPRDAEGTPDPGRVSAGAQQEQTQKARRRTRQQAPDGKVDGAAEAGDAPGFRPTQGHEARQTPGFTPPDPSQASGDSPDKAAGPPAGEGKAPRRFQVASDRVEKQKQEQTQKAQRRRQRREDFFQQQAPDEQADNGAAIEAESEDLHVDALTHFISLEELEQYLGVAAYPEDRRKLEARWSLQLREPTIQRLLQEIKRERLSYALIPRLPRMLKGGQKFTTTVVNLLRNYPQLFENVPQVIQYKAEPFFSAETPALDWAIVACEVLPESCNKSFMEQRQVLRQYAQRFHAPELRVRRRTLVEALYDVIVIDLITKEPVLTKSVDLTDSRVGRYNHACINFGAQGVRINDVSGQQAHPGLGLCPSW